MNTSLAGLLIFVDVKTSGLVVMRVPFTSALTVRQKIAATANIATDRLSNAGSSVAARARHVTHSEIKPAPIP